MARRSITFDRGTEFTDWPYLQAGLGTQTWFCDPQSPWQKGTVENTNSRARKWLSREVDPLAVSDSDLRRSATSSTRHRANASATKPPPSLPAKDHGEDAINALACRCSKVALQRELTRPAICPPVRSARARLRRRGAIGQFGQSDQHVDEQILGFTIIRIVVRAQVEIRTLHRYAAHATRRKVSTVHGEVRSFPPRSDRRRP